MNSLAIFLVLGSAILHALRNFLTKTAFDKQVFMWCYQVVSLILFLPLFIYFFIQEGGVMASVWWIILASGIVHFLYWVGLSLAYEGGDLSHVYPIIRSSPAIVLLFSVFFLNERVSLFGVMGVLTIALGVYMINLKGLSYKKLLEPIRSIFTESHTRYAFFTLFIVAAYSLLDGLGARKIHPLVFIYCIAFVTMSLFTPYVLMRKPKTAILKEWNFHKSKILINGVIGFLGYAFILIAFNLSKISYVVGLRQLSIVFAVLLGGHVLKEEYKLIRFLAASLIFIGAFLITIA